jgi:pimeloyl-ACP methyl ester carboxylesterase
MTKTIMLIHGAWLTPSSWDRFRGRYEAQGYTVVTPAWPFVSGSPAEQRAKPDPRLAKMGVKDIVDHFEAEIRKLPEAPILMGHSFGGLFVQLLLDRGLGAVGVAIDPGAPFGVLVHPTAVLTSLPVFTTWNAWNKVLPFTRKSFAKGFANTLPESQLAAEYDANIVPSPGRIFYDVVLGRGAKVNWKNPARPPLLLIAAEHDRTVPLPMVRTNYAKQKRAPSATAFHEFYGRSHYLCNEAGWEDVADYCLEWAVSHLPAANGRPALAAVA